MAYSAGELYKKPDIAIYYYRDTPFYPGFAMNYMQRGHYIAVINPLSYSSLISSDKDLSYGLYDTKTNQFFPPVKMPTPRYCMA
jgi:sensor c-di-GMP phosphodiesterase-like protein